MTERAHPFDRMEVPVGDPLPRETIIRLVKGLGSVDIQSLSGARLRIEGLKEYNYHMDYLKPMERKPREAATVALWLTLRTMNRRPNNDHPILSVLPPSAPDDATDPASVPGAAGA